ncbi:MAG: heparan-alpha-glucosaminide N-acetyltransferase domain-containing protein [Vicinamibacterales bacterium]
MATARPRIGALDLLRGATVAAMILVNNPGNWNAVYRPLVHAPWHGLTAADLIFPAFVFIMGVAMSLALPGRSHDAGLPHRAILTRGVWLVLMGLTLNVVAAWPHLGSVRIPGVLQRIGLTYVVAAYVLLSSTRRSPWAWIVSLLVLHTVVLRAGGPLEPAVNLSARVDEALFGAHLLSADGDPEGALGLLTSVATALLGAVAGRALLRRSTDAPSRSGTAALLAMGGGMVVAGLVLSAWLPINKALWTASFVLVASGVAALGLAACVALAGERATRIAAPLFWLGTNPLAIYFLSELTTTAMQWPLVSGRSVKDVVFWDALVPALGDNGGPFSSLAFALLYTSVWIAVAGTMKWRGIRLRV